MLDITDKKKSFLSQYGLSLLIVSIGALYFFYDAMLIVFPAAVADELMTKFNIAATGLSFLSAVYFYIYSPLQLPDGALLDRFGPKRIMLIGLIICTLGLSLLSITHNYTLAVISRIMMGIGASAGYIAPMLLIARWFPKQYYVILTGILILIECTGAIFGESAVLWFSKYMNFDNVLLLLAGFGLLIFSLVTFFVQDYPQDKLYIPLKIHYKSLFSKICHLALSKEVWLIGISATLLWSPTSIFSSLWGVNYLHEAYQISKLSASNYMMMSWMGVGLGGPIVGYISHKMNNNRLLPVMLCALMGLITSLVLIINFSFTYFLLPLLLFCLGISSASQVLMFGLINDKFTSSYAATAFGFVNMCICFGNAIFQMIAGSLLDWITKSEHYTAHDYQLMLTLLPLCFVCVLILCHYFLGKKQNINDHLNPSSLTLKEEPL